MVKEKLNNIQDFTILRQVGQGGFGEVYQVQHNESHGIFALKRVPLDAHASCVERECDILSRLAVDPHPHLIRLWDSFLSTNHAHLVLDFLDGGDLHSQLQEDGLFAEDHARTCMAEIVSAVAHLHAHGILHRDIKPENVLLDSHGHAKLADLGLAVDLGRESPAYHTMRSPPCGTRLFMAPEMLRGEDYSYALDWWSVGVLFYEMVAGCLPFGDRGRRRCGDIKADNIDYVEVLTRRPRLPTDLSRDCHSLLKGLLQKDPTKRLHTAQEIKMHPWFKKVDWTKLEHRISSSSNCTAGLHSNITTGSLRPSGIGELYNEELQQAELYHAAGAQHEIILPSSIISSSTTTPGRSGICLDTQCHCTLGTIRPAVPSNILQPPPAGFGLQLYTKYGNLTGEDVPYNMHMYNIINYAPVQLVDGITPAPPPPTSLTTTNFITRHAGPPPGLIGPPMCNIIPRYVAPQYYYALPAGPAS